MHSFSQAVPCKGPWVAVLLQGWAGWHRSHFPCILLVPTGRYRARGAGWGVGEAAGADNSSSCVSGTPPKSCACFSFSQVRLFTGIPFHFLFLHLTYVILRIKPRLQMHARQTLSLLSYTACHLLVHVHVRALWVVTWVHLCYGRCMWRPEDNLKGWALYLPSSDRVLFISCVHPASCLSSFPRFCVCFLCPHRSAVIMDSHIMSLVFMGPLRILSWVLMLAFSK